ncbi:MAG TPA: hypothetical protein VGH89_13945, partial [Pseudonocardia sp.]
RPAFWPLFILVGALIAMAMLVGAFMTLKLYLRPEEHRDPGQLPELDDHPDDFPPSWKRHTP